MVSGHANEKMERLHGCADIGFGLYRDVEGGAMGRCRYGDGQAAGDDHTALKAHQLDRDLSLVVIHGDHGVDLAAFGFEKDRVRGPWIGNTHLPPAGTFNRGLEYINLFAAELAIVARMRIKRGDGDSGPRGPGTAQVEIAAGGHHEFGTIH